MTRRLLEERLAAESGPLFANEMGGNLTSALIGQKLWLRRSKLPIGKFTTHDLRRTAATMMTEMGIALDLVAAIVGHQAGGKETRTLVRHYVHSDLIERKAHALRRWGERIMTIVTGRGVAKVVQLRGSR
jgi:integrase